MFPSTSLKNGRRGASKRKRSSAEMICDSFNGLIIALSSRSTQSTAAQMRASKEDAALTEAFAILNSMEHDIKHMENMSSLHPGSSGSRRFQNLKSHQGFQRHEGIIKDRRWYHGISS
ncbi:hypothetical protein ACET3Z_005443 [Daucus carota]